MLRKLLSYLILDSRKSVINYVDRQLALAKDDRRKEDPNWHCRSLDTFIAENADPAESSIEVRAFLLVRRNQCAHLHIIVLVSTTLYKFVRMWQINSNLITKLFSDKLES